MKTLHLYQTIYSKTKTCDKAIENLTAYPEQGVNCVQAFKHSMEFTMKPGMGQMVGTLSEYKNDADIFVLHFTDGTVTAKKQDNTFYTVTVQNTKENI